MKHFILVALFSLGLVGQISCDWQDNAKKVVKGTAVSLATSGCGYLVGRLFSKELAFDLALLCAACNGIHGCYRVVKMKNEGDDNPWYGTGKIIGVGLAFSYLNSLLKPVVCYRL